MWYELKWCFVFCLVIGIVSFILGQLLPRKWFCQGDELWFAPFQREKNGKLYEKLNIRNWKDKVPDMSRICRRMVAKALPQKLSAEGLTLLIRETCVAELTHEILMVVGFVCYLHFRSRFSFFLSVLWALGNLPYVLIQRFNRPRFMQLREHILQKSHQMSSMAATLPGTIQ